MGTARQPAYCRLFTAITYSRDDDAADVDARLSGLYGQSEHRCGPLAFGFTDYYTAEMGPNLQKYYIVYDRPFDRAELAEIKTASNKLEEIFLSADGKRRVNIDPGYLNKDKLVLASTKDFYHRLYLAQGIYAEVTLHFSKRGWITFPWTYRDYCQPEVLAMLTQARAALVGELRRAPHA